MANWTPPYNPYALGHILGSSQVITGASNATPVVVTIANHGYSNNQTIRVSGVVTNTAANGDWIITVVDANNFSLNGSVGNGGFGGGSPIAARFLLPLTYNNPTLTGMGITVNSITFQAFASNTGNIYVGGLTGGLIATPAVIPKRVTPFTDMIYVIKPGLTQNMPFFSPGASNIISIDQFGIDWDNLGEGVLVSIFFK